MARVAVSSREGTSRGKTWVLVLGLTVLSLACSGAEGTGPKDPSSPMSLAVAQSMVSQGDTLSFTVTLPGPVYLVLGDSLTITLGGVASGSASLAIPANVFAFSFALVVPAAVPDGKLSITASVAAVHESSEAALTVKDTTPPFFDSIGVHGAPFSTMVSTAQASVILLGAGLTDTIAVSAHDNHALRSVGWDVRGPAGVQDYVVAANGPLATVEAPIAMPESLAGTTVPLTLVAVDADGNTQSWPEFAASVVGFNQHPVRTAAIVDTITDLAVDTTRGLVYLAQPDSARIGVLSLSTMTYEAPISLSGRPISLDLTPGGDSLLVVLDSTTSVSVVGLGGTPQVVGTIPMQPNPFETDVALAYRVRVSADGLAMVTIRSPNFGSGGDFVVEQITLATGAQVIPWNYYYHYAVVPPPSTRSGDANVILVPGTGGLYYNASIKEYGEPDGTWNSSNPFYYSVSNPTANDVLTGHALSLGAGGASVIGLDTLWGTVVDPKGANVYVADAACAPGNAACADTAAGVLIQYQPGLWYLGNNLMFPDAAKALNVSVLPHAATSLIVAPDGKTLFAIGTHTITAVDLTTSIPPSNSVLQTVHRALGSRLDTRAAGPRRLKAASNPSAVKTSTTWDLRSALIVRPVRR